MQAGTTKRPRLAQLGGSLQRGSLTGGSGRPQQAGGQVKRGGAHSKDEVGNGTTARVEQGGGERRQEAKEASAPYTKPASDSRTIAVVRRRGHASSNIKYMLPPSNLQQQVQSVFAWPSSFTPGLATASCERGSSEPKVWCSVLTCTEGSTPQTATLTSKQLSLCCAPGLPACQQPGWHRTPFFSLVVSSCVLVAVVACALSAKM